MVFSIIKLLLVYTKIRFNQATHFVLPKMLSEKLRMVKCC